MNFSKSDLIQSERMLWKADVSKNRKDDEVLQSLRTSEDPHRPEGYILPRVPVCTRLRDLSYLLHIKYKGLMYTKRMPQRESNKHLV